MNILKEEKEKENKNYENKLKILNEEKEKVKKNYEKKLKFF